MGSHPLVGTRMVTQSCFAFQVVMSFQSQDLITRVMSTKFWQLQHLMEGLLVVESGNR